MKKFSDISDKDASMDFKKKKQSKDLSTDIDNLDDQVSDEVKSTILDGEWEIQSIMNVSTEPPSEDEIKSNEAIIINAELGNEPVKRGDFIYITALINKRGSSSYHQSQMGVIKVRVVEIFNTLLILNQLR